jgi:hypothetical protein
LAFGSLNENDRQRGIRPRKTRKVTKKGRPIALPEGHIE